MSQRKRILLLTLILTFWASLSSEAYAQRVTNGSYQTIANIKSDGTVQDSNYRTIGYAKGIPARWAAYYFFFFKS